jgi:tetrathionate reductase subunit B
MNELESTKVSRRRVLKGVGTAAVGVAATALPLAGAEAAKAKAPRWGMVMDVRKCIGCRACTVACKAEEKTWGTFPDTKKVFLPIMCNHCEGNAKDKVPPCVKACPEYPGKRLTYVTPDGKKIRYRGGATYKRPDGLILMDKELCIGCGKCIDGCPYGVRSFDPFVKAGKKPNKQAVDKCTMCDHLIDQGQAPACVTTCQGRARIFGDLNDPTSEVSKLVKEHNLDKKRLLLDKETDPQVFYIDPDNVLETVYTPQSEEGNLDHYVDLIP